MKKQITAFLEEEVIKSFQEHFPDCLKKFIVKCMKLAVRDKSFFERIFFSEVD